MNLRNANVFYICIHFNKWKIIEGHISYRTFRFILLFVCRYLFSLQITHSAILLTSCCMPTCNVMNIPKECVLLYSMFDFCIHIAMQSAKSGRPSYGASIWDIFICFIQRRSLYSTIQSDTIFIFIVLVMVRCVHSSDGLSLSDYYCALWNAIDHCTIATTASWAMPPSVILTMVRIYVYLAREFI